MEQEGKFDMINMNTTLGNNLNTFPSSLNIPKATGMQTAQPRFGANMRPTTQAFKAQLLQMRIATGNMLETIGSLRSVALEAAKDVHSSRIDPTNTDYPQIRHSRPFGRRIIAHYSETGLRAGQCEGRPSDAADSAVDAGFNLGNNRLMLNMNGHSFEFTFNVSETDTLGNVQQKIADAINEWNGHTIFATVTTDSKTGSSILAVEYCFSILDENGSMSGGVAISSGGRYEALFTDAKHDYERSKENFDRFFNNSSANWRRFLDNGRRLDFNDTTDSQVAMQLQHDIIKLGTMRAFVENFNEMLKAWEVWELGEELSNLIEIYSADLETIGIFADEAYFLQIDKDIMRIAIENGEFERFIFDGGQGGTSGFINRVERIIESVVTQNPPGLLFETVV